MYLHKSFIIIRHVNNNNHHQPLMNFSYWHGLNCLTGTSKTRGSTRFHCLFWLNFYSLVSFLMSTTPQSVLGIFYLAPSPVLFTWYQYLHQCLVCGTVDLRLWFCCSGHVLYLKYLKYLKYSNAPHLDPLSSP